MIFFAVRINLSPLVTASPVFGACPVRILGPCRSWSRAIWVCDIFSALCKLLMIS